MLFVNYITMCRLLPFVIKKINEKKSLSLFQKRKKRFMAFLTFSTMMGLGWIFGIIPTGNNETAKYILQLLFCICSTFQGFMFFLIYLWGEDDPLQYWRRLCCPKRPNHTSSTSQSTSKTSKKTESSVA